MSDPNTALKLFGDKCTQLLQESEIRFAGIVDQNGKLVAGGFKDGLVPYEGDETKLQSFFDFVSKLIDILGYQQYLNFFDFQLSQ